MVRGPPCGYFPEPTKNVLVVSPHNFLRAEDLFCGYRLQIVTGIHYLGVFIGTESYQSWWLGEKIAGWRDLVENLAGVARRHP